MCVCVLGGGNGISYCTSGIFNGGGYEWESTSDPVTLSPRAYCSLPTEDCVTMDHGCGMLLKMVQCIQFCYAICEYHP